MFKRRGRTSTDAWQVLRGSYEGQPLFARVNTGVQPLVGDRHYGIQIGVAVPFNDRQVSGLPTESEIEDLNRVEEVIDSSLAARGVLVGIITTNNMREFVIYTGSGDWIADFHRDVQAAVTTHEIQVMAKRDPEWDVYRSFVNR